MDYSFKLYWDELDEDLKERKIDEYIEYLKKNGEEIDDRDRVERTIEAHFPIYF